jgi:DNA-binding transcriptional ArsR family regulator
VNVVKSSRAGAADSTCDELAEGVVQRMCEVFHMLADPLRLKIMLTLAQKGAMNVSALAARLGRRQPVISSRLAKLRHAGLVGWDREGKRRIYRLEAPRANGILKRLFEEMGDSLNHSVPE